MKAAKSVRWQAKTHISRHGRPLRHTRCSSWRSSNKALDAVKADLDRFDALIARKPRSQRLVRSPVFGADEQLKALSAILDKAGINGLAANFLRVITTNRRLFAVRDMIRGYRALVARQKGEVTAQVTVAEKLSDKNLDALKGALKSVTGGKDIDLDVKVEPGHHRRADRQARQPHGRLAPSAPSSMRSSSR